MKYPANQATVGFPLFNQTPRDAIAKLANAYRGRTVDRIVVISIDGYDVKTDPVMLSHVQTHMGAICTQIDYRKMTAQDFDAFADDEDNNITLTLP